MPNKIITSFNVKNIINKENNIEATPDMRKIAEFPDFVACLMPERVIPTNDHVINIKNKDIITFIDNLLLCNNGIKTA
ncbi:MAG: hypothetical protein P4L66_08565 [Acetobacteraceae bacterium]|nr:hypothetical protein [Acetobacteraceae bacterium]